jgi:signal transduction histidine kinase
MAEATSLSNQVLANLLDNAIKFSTPGKSISLNLRAHGKSEVELEVIDEGIGMPPEMKQKIFDDAVRVSRPGTQEESGTGAGLLVVRDFMHAYGARVEVESSPDAGTKFTLLFRRAEPEAKDL